MTLGGCTVDPPSYFLGIPTLGGSRINQGVDQGKRGALWVEPSAGSRDRAPGAGPLKLKSFCPASYKRGAKVKDLNETI